MTENSEQLLLLLGEMKGDMMEGQKQRSRLFQLLEKVSDSVSRLSGRFEERCKSDDEWREEMSARMAKLEETQRSSGAAPSEEPAVRRRGLSLSLLTVVGSGGGLAAMFFGSGLANLFRQGIDLLKKIPH